MRTEYLVGENGVPGWKRTYYPVEENGVTGWMRTEYLNFYKVF